MNPRYTLRQQKIYSDYTPKSDQHLLEIFQKKNNYVPEVIEIITDILAERNKLPETVMSEIKARHEKEEKYTYAAEMLLKLGKSPVEAEQILINDGMDENTSEQVLKNLAADEAKRNSKKNMLWGAVWCIGGILVTALTYSNASSGGGSYVVAWGAIVFGAVQFFKGLLNS
jgi:hypothetical protein